MKTDSNQSPPAHSPTIDAASIKKQSVRGGAVTFIAQALALLIQLVSTITLARLLSPNDYGTMAMIVAITNFIYLFQDMGLSPATIHKENITHAQSSNLFWLNTVTGAALSLLMAILSPAIAWFYDRPEFLALSLFLSPIFIISSLGAQHSALLQRNLQFTRLAIARIVPAFLGLITAFILALNGFSYWSLAWSSIANVTSMTLLLFIFSAFRPGKWTKGIGTMHMLKFGANITAFNFVNYFQRNLDQILIGRFWGAGPLGLYNRAYQLLMFPINNLRVPINTVAYPAMSRLQNQPKELKEYYLKTTHLIALLSMPLTAFLAVAASPIIEIALGKNWSGVVPIFQCLAITAFIQPTTSATGSLLLAMGLSKRFFHSGLFVSIVVCIFFLAGLPWGAIGVAIAYTIANYLLLYPWLKWVFFKTPVTFFDFLRACSFPALVSLPPIIISFCLNLRIEPCSPWLHLLLIAIIFAVTVLPPVFFKERALLRSFINMICKKRAS